MPVVRVLVTLVQFNTSGSHRKYYIMGAYSTNNVIVQNMAHATACRDRDDHAALSTKLYL